MNRLAQFTVALLGAAALAACSPGVNEGFGHRITFDSSGMVVHAAGHANAHVGRDGSLRIGDKSIAVTAGERQLLQQYYQQADALFTSARAVGKRGAKLGAEAVGSAIDSILHGHSSAAEEQLNTQATGIQNAANALCQNLAALGSTQKAIAAQLPAFEPYVAGSMTNCEVTTHAAHPAGSTSTAASALQARNDLPGTVAAAARAIGPYSSAAAALSTPNGSRHA